MCLSHVGHVDLSRLRQEAPLEEEGAEKKGKKKRVISKAFISDSDEEMGSERDEPTTEYSQMDAKRLSGSDNEEEEDE